MLHIAVLYYYFYLQLTDSPQHLLIEIKRPKEKYFSILDHYKPRAFDKLQFIE